MSKQLDNSDKEKMAVAKLKRFFPLFKKDPEAHEKFMMRLAIEEAIQGFKIGDGPPFGAAIAKDKRVVCRGRNEVVKNNDPTAHAELVAIRKACKLLDSDTLEGCVLYTSCEPCPMCLSLCAMVNINKIYYGAGLEDANKAGYKKSSAEFYKNLKKKDYLKKSYCKQVMASQANIALRQLMQEYESRENDAGIAITIDNAVKQTDSVDLPKTDDMNNDVPKSEADLNDVTQTDDGNFVTQLDNK